MTDSDICKAFDAAVDRLWKHSITVRSDGTFILIAGEKVVSKPETVDGLAAFADALDYALSTGAPK